MSYQLWFSQVERVVRRVREVVNALIDPQIDVDEENNELVLVYNIGDYEDAKIIADFLNNLLRREVREGLVNITQVDTRIDVYVKTK